MGMNSKDVLSYSDTSQSRKEARRARADAVRHFDQKETARHREAIANCRGEARQARTQRKAQRTTAKERCEGYVREAKEKGRDKPPYRRRADLANARKACALDLAHVEEQAAQALEAADQKCNEEKARRRSSRTSAKHERARAKERERATSRERLDEMFGQIRNDLEPGLLPYFEEIKGSAALKKLLNGGRMTPTEAVLQMAHEDPEAVFAALERQAEKELQELLREQERWEYEGGRVGEDASEDTSLHVLSDPGTTTEEVAPAENKPRRASRGKPAKAGDTKGAAREQKAGGDTTSSTRERKPRARRSKGEQGPSRASTPRETCSELKTAHEGDTRSAGIHPDGEDWIATTWAESHRFNVHADALAWLRDRGFHADGSPIGRVDASAPPDARARPEVTQTAPREAPSCGGRCQRSAADDAPVEKKRFSAEERTGWLPGTEPERAPLPEPAPSGRTTLFEEEPETEPETPEAKRRQSERHARREHGTQQVFGTTFTSWLNQAGPQLTLEQAPRTHAEPARAHTDPSGAVRAEATEISRAPIHDEPARDDTDDGHGTEEENDDENEVEGEGEASPSDLYERKRARRISRMRARAAQLEQASSSIYESARARADRIPFGQPILVGHHSEGRDRRFRTKISTDFRKAAELDKEADDLRRRADAAESGRTISSDDPDAIAKLSAKVEERGDFIARARRINDVLHTARAGRKTGWEPLAVQRLVTIGIDRETAESLTRKNALGRFGIPGSEVRNAQAEIVRLNRRIYDLERRDARPVRAPERIGEAVIVENRETNRVEIRLDAVPPKELREQLRGRGFVWAPSAGAWQRKLNERAFWAARQVLNGFYLEGRAAKATGVPIQGLAPEREPGLDEEPYSASGGTEAPAPF